MLDGELWLWEGRITTEATEIKAGEQGNDQFWNSTKTQDKAGLQNDLSRSSVLWVSFAPFQVGEGVRDPNLLGMETRAQGCGSQSLGAVGREADRVLNDSQVRFV